MSDHLGSSVVTFFCYLCYLITPVPVPWRSCTLDFILILEGKGIFSNFLLTHVCKKILFISKVVRLLKHTLQLVAYHTNQTFWLCSILNWMENHNMQIRVTITLTTTRLSFPSFSFHEMTLVSFV